MDFLDVSLRMTHDHHTPPWRTRSELLAVPLGLRIWKFRRPSGGWFRQFPASGESVAARYSLFQRLSIWAPHPCRLWKEQAVADGGSIKAVMSHDAQEWIEVCNLINSWTLWKSRLVMNGMAAPSLAFWYPHPAAIRQVDVFPWQPAKN